MVADWSPRGRGTGGDKLPGCGSLSFRKSLLPEVPGETAGLVCTHSPKASVGLRWRGDDLEKWVDFTGGRGEWICLGQGEGLRSTCEGRSWVAGEGSLVKLVSSDSGIWQAWWCWLVTRPGSVEDSGVVGWPGTEGDRDSPGCGKLGQGAA